MADITTPTRKAPRRARPVDVAAFAAEVDAALDAFRQDVFYAVAMARSAVTIGRKREAWAARKELRIAEAAARAQCETVEAFDCHAHAPCGVGDCKFAEAELAALDVPASTKATTTRPQICCTGTPHYAITDAVEPLLKARSGSR